MTANNLIRADDFSEISEVRPDAKMRITLKKVKTAAHHYKVYLNAAGQIILDPQVAIPASELWLFKNRQALASVQKGLRQSAEGKLAKRPSLAKHADEEID